MGLESSILLAQLCVAPSERERKRLEWKLRGNLRLGDSEKIGRDKLLLLTDIQDNPFARRLVHIYTNKNKEINISELIQGLLLFITEGDMLPKLQLSFRIYDLDGDGYISIFDLYQVLRQLLGSQYSEERLKKMAVYTIMMADTDGDRKLSYEEYLKFMANVKIQKKASVKCSALNPAEQFWYNW